MKNPAVLEKIAETERMLGEDGRLLVRCSGTEPLVRVMAEARDTAVCEQYVDGVIAVMRKEGLVLD